MTVRTILIVGALAFLGLLATAFGVTFFAPDTDALYINLAGRQRMLSQKVSKEALGYLDDPTAAQAGKVDQTANLFRATHKALLGGGSAPTQLDGSKPAAVAGATDAELQRLLGEVGKHWTTLDNAINAARAKATKRQTAIAALEEKNLVLLRKMDEAVRMMAAANLSGDMVNIAGRQRMLSQKVFKETLLFERRPTAENAAQAKATIKLFDTSLKALLHGGSVPLKLDGSVPRLIDGVGERPQLVAQLEQVEGLWADHRDALSALFDPKNNMAADRATILATNLKVLKTMNQAVGQAQAVAEARLAEVRTVNAIAVTAGLALALCSVFVALGIGGSLRRLKQAADEISTGELDSPVPSGRFGEIRDLSASLERMRTSLGQAMRMLEDDDDADPLLAG